jgi:hypothetical protein
MILFTPICSIYVHPTAKSVHDSTARVDPADLPLPLAWAFPLLTE